MDVYFSSLDGVASDVKHAARAPRATRAARIQYTLSRLAMSASFIAMHGIAVDCIELRGTSLVGI